MAEIVPVDQFLDWYPGWTARADRQSVGVRTQRPLHGRRTRAASGSSTSTGLAASRRSVTCTSPTVRHGARRPPRTSCPSRRRRAWCSAWAAPSRTRERSPTTSEWELGFRAAAHRAQHAPVPAELRRDLGGAQVGARARARLLRELRLRGQVPGRDRSVHGRCAYLPQAGVGDPLRADVPLARDLPPALRAVRIERDRPGPRGEVLPGP